MIAKAQTLTKIPEEKMMPFLRSSVRDPPDNFANERILSDKTGNTHGIRFKSSPPINALIMAIHGNKPEWLGGVLIGSATTATNLGSILIDNWTDSGMHSSLHTIHSAVAFSVNG